MLAEIYANTSGFEIFSCFALVYTVFYGAWRIVVSDDERWCEYTPNTEFYSRCKTVTIRRVYFKRSFFDPWSWREFNYEIKNKHTGEITSFHMSDREAAKRLLDIPEI